MLMNCPGRLEMFAATCPRASWLWSPVVPGRVLDLGGPFAVKVEARLAGGGHAWQLADALEVVKVADGPPEGLDGLGQLAADLEEFIVHAGWRAGEQRKLDLAELVVQLHQVRLEAADELVEDENSSDGPRAFTSCGTSSQPRCTPARAGGARRAWSARTAR
jgi:hypothetical protein